MRQTPDRRFVIVGGASGDRGTQSSSPAVAVVTTQTETHALDSASHTGTLASHQAPQFALLDGSRPFVGPIMINLTSIAAPFVFSVNAIGQLVTGLNADLLDGHDATYFSVAGHLHAHNTLTGLANDDHTQYLNTTRHDLAARRTPVQLCRMTHMAISAALARTIITPKRTDTPERMATERLRTMY